MLIKNQKSIVASMAAVAALLLLSTLPAHAVPSFGRQMGMECSGCHTVFPELNSFGRQFKLRGFTLGNALDDKKFPLNLPLSAVVVGSRTMTSNTNTPGAVPEEQFPRDAQTVLQTAGLYYGGRIAGNFGALVQYNYDGIEYTSKIEMADIRYANSTALNGKELLFGVTLNNNPTVSDVFSSMPMWSFPHLMRAPTTTGWAGTPGTTTRCFCMDGSCSEAPGNRE